MEKFEDCESQQHPYLNLSDIKEVEGYYLGSRAIPLPKGPTYLHVLKTDSRLIGIWGFTRLDDQLINYGVKPGHQVRIKHKAPIILEIGKKKYNSSVQYDKERLTEVNQDEVDLFASNASLKHLHKLFVMPNGSVLRYSAHYDKGNEDEAFRIGDTEEVRTWNPDDKKKRYRLYLRSSKTRQHCVAADFDGLPPGFASYDDLYDYLYTSLAIPKKAVVFRSPSGKVKAIFVVELPRGTAMSDEIAIQVLGDNLPGELPLLLDIPLKDTEKVILDSSGAALRNVFLTTSIIEAISTQLPNVIPCSVSPVELRGAWRDIDIVEDRNRESNSEQLAHDLIVAKGSIPKEFDEFINYGRRQAQVRETFVRILLGAYMLTSPKGFGLSTPMIGTQLNVSPKTVSNWRDSFVRKGWLVLIDDTFMPKVKAQTFKADGELAYAIGEVGPLNHSSSSPKDLPTEIAYGHWLEAMWEAIFHFRHKTKEEFMAWRRTIPGHNLPGNGGSDRTEEAEKLWDYRMRRFQEYRDKKKTLGSNKTSSDAA